MSRYVDIDPIIASHTNAEYKVSDISFAEVFYAPSIDIVRCQDCKHWVYNFNGCARNPCTEPWYATDGCTYGERRGDEQ